MEHLIFDCDGVLVDSEIHLVNAEINFLERYGVEMSRTDYVQRFTGTSLAQWEREVAELIAASGVIPPTALDFRQLAERVDRHLKDALTAIAGAHAFLTETQRSRCVASGSTPDQLAWKLRLTELDGYFGDRVFSSTQVQNGKPAPDLFLHAAAQMGVDPSRCLVIEDSANGVRAAESGRYDGDWAGGR